jgi:hypothetical protein
LKEYRAEDFVMGKFAAEAGHGVILSSYVVENHIGSLGLRHNAAHRLRWVRSTRRSRPAGYLGQLFTMPVPLALMVCLADPTWWQVLPLTLFVRGVAAYVVSARVLAYQDQLAPASCRRSDRFLFLASAVLRQQYRLARTAISSLPRRTIQIIAHRRRRLARFTVTVERRFNTVPILYRI